MSVLREISLLKQLGKANHPNIVRCVGSFRGCAIENRISQFLNNCWCEESFWCDRAQLEAKSDLLKEFFNHPNSIPCQRNENPSVTQKVLGKTHSIYWYSEQRKSLSYCDNHVKFKTRKNGNAFQSLKLNIFSFNTWNVAIVTLIFHILHLMAW